MISAPFTLVIDVDKPHNVGWASSEHPTDVHGDFNQAISRLARDVQALLEEHLVLAEVRDLAEPPPP